MGGSPGVSESEGDRAEQQLFGHSPDQNVGPRMCGW